MTIQIISKAPLNLWAFAKRISPCRTAAYLRWHNIDDNTLSTAALNGAMKQAAKLYPHMASWELLPAERKAIARRVEILRFRASFLIASYLPYCVLAELKTGKHIIKGRRDEGDLAILSLSDIADVSVELGDNCLVSSSARYRDIAIDFEMRPPIANWAGQNLQRVIHELICLILEQDKPVIAHGWQAGVLKKLRQSPGMENVDASTLRKYAQPDLTAWEQKTSVK